MAEHEVEGLLAGPRGRRFLVEVAELQVLGGELPRATTAWWGPTSGRDGTDLPADVVTACLDRLTALLAQVDLATIADLRAPHALLEPLATSVAWARYWQDPDPIDHVLADPRATELLRPVAAALLAAPAAAWWRDGVDLDLQQHVQWVRRPQGRQPVTPALTPSGETWWAWRADQAAQESTARDRRPRDVAAPFGGEWWSTSWRATGVVGTSPVVGAQEPLPVGLTLVEDSGDDPEALVHPLRPRPGARVLEVHDARTWCDLVAAHPRDVTWSRRHCWWRATGWAGSWALPDWASVAQDWDGVHLSALGYLAISGRLLPTTVPGVGAGVDHLTPGPAHTLLAGWDPGQTWWLTSALNTAGVQERWHALDHDDALLQWSRHH